MGHLGSYRQAEGNHLRLATVVGEWPPPSSSSSSSSNVPEGIPLAVKESAIQWRWALNRRMLVPEAGAEFTDLQKAAHVMRPLIRTLLSALQ
jgi:hypothetical protein